MSEPDDASLDKTTLKRIEQYRDRWSSRDAGTGLLSISDRLSAAELREIELFADFDDKLLEKISPDVSVAVWSEGSVLFEEGTYIDLAFFVLAGEVEIYLQGVEPAGEQGARPIFDLSRTVLSPIDAGGEDVPERGTVLMKRATRVSRHEITFLATMDFDLPRGAAARLGPGELFGEIGALSGWPQSVTARAASECRLVQIRVPALRFMRRRSAALKERLDRLYKERSLAAQLKSSPIFRSCPDVFVEALKETVDLVSCEPDEVIVREGETVDGLYLVRSGFVKLQQTFGEDELAVSYLSKGMTLGELELLLDRAGSWESTAVSVEYCELIRVPTEVFGELLKVHPGLEKRLWKTAADRIREAGFARRNVRQAEFTQVALDTGLVQGNSVLAIDLNLCTRCDDCVRACAATHEGRPRFVREGEKYQNLLIAKSCFHCRDPVCLVGCPTGAIHRSGVGEVVAVDEEICIGCSTCANNCPYDAIVMYEPGAVWAQDMVPSGLRGRERRLASKCDLCHDTGHGPACVSNCPQGCAFRVGSLADFQRLLEVESGG